MVLCLVVKLHVSETLVEFGEDLSKSGVEENLQAMTPNVGEQP
jgi:hypothetical protein